MPAGKLAVHVLEGKYLPANDTNIVTKTKTSDPYFVVGLSDDKHKHLKAPKPFKSKAVPKEISPKWTEPAWIVEFPVPEAQYILIQIFDHEMIGQDVLLKSIAIPLAELVSDPTSYTEVVRTYKTQLEENQTNKKAKACTIEGGGEIKAMIRFIGADWEKVHADKTRAFIRAASKKQPQLDLKVVENAAELFMKSANGQAHYQITSKESLESFLEQCGLLETVLNLDVFSVKNLMVYSPDKTMLQEWEKQLLAESPEWRKHQLDLLWTMCDIDGNGKVSFQEILMVLALESNGDIKQRGEFSFRLLDKDGSGSLSKQEILDLQELYFRSFKILFVKEFLDKLNEDAEHKGKLISHDAEMKIKTAILDGIEDQDVPQRLADKVLALADTNHSGEVSKEEYLEFLQNEENQQAVEDLLTAILVEIGVYSGMVANAELLHAASHDGATSYF